MEDKEKQSAVAAPASSTGKKPFYGWVVVVACGLVYLLFIEPLSAFYANMGRR